MRAILILMLCFFTIGAIAQTDAVKLETKENGNRLEFWVSNTTDYPMEVELFVFNRENLRGRKTTQASIPAHDKVLVRKMKIKGEYSFNYELKKSYSEEALASKEKNIDDVDIHNGIIVFNKKGCSRCQFLVNYLMDNEIDFQLMDLGVDTNKEFMYGLLEDSGVYKKKVMTPIVVVDDKISYSHENLEQFALGLK